ncbi:MAG: ABC transporter substrate-binding protein [Bacteroidota bacterium]
MNKALIYAALTSLLLASCSGGNGDKSDPDGKEQPKKREAKGGEVVYGGTFHVSNNEKHKTLFPYDIKEIGTAHIAWQVYEGLVRLSQKDLSIQPSLAEKWEVSDDMLEYTFHLKKGVFFHDDPCFTGGKGRELKASDVKFSFELLATKGVSDEAFGNSIKERIEGANDFYNGKAKEISGISISDDYTVKIRTITPSSSFLYILANPVTAILPKEAWDKYGKEIAVGTGAFMVTKGGDPNKELILAAHPKYHRKDKWENQLPYLDTVHFHFVAENTEELEMFRANKLSMIYGLPAEKITEVVQKNIPDFTNKPPKYILLREPEMSVQFYEINMKEPHFQNVKVRQALAYAIDRTKIMEDILNNQAAANGPSQQNTGNYGLTPPLYQFSKYDTSKIKGYNYNPDLARKLMREAGYPEGKGFPTITLEVNYGAKNIRVANEIISQWKEVLGINVELEQVSLAQKIEDSEYGRADIFRSAWVADYPSPETFLSICYGKNVPESMDKPSHPNTMRYKSAEFDKNFELGMSAKTEEERYQYFAEAERIMMEDCPVIIIWYVENYRLIQSSVHNYFNNPMNYYDLSDIYIKPLKAEKEKKAE